jgi:hypothetical protein
MVVFSFLARVGVFLSVIAPALATELTGLSSDDRQSIELACVIDKGHGPAAYHACLNNQLAQLGNGHAPDITKLSSDDRQSIELACVIDKGHGPAAYHACLNNQLASLRNAGQLGASPGTAQNHAATTSPTTGASVQPSPIPPPPSSSVSPPTTVTPACSESGSCYGDISSITGLPKTTYVHGYYRSDGTYVRSYYRSH